MLRLALVLRGAIACLLGGDLRQALADLKAAEQRLGNADDAAVDPGVVGRATGVVGRATGDVVAAALSATALAAAAQSAARVAAAPSSAFFASAAALADDAGIVDGAVFSATSASTACVNASDFGTSFSFSGDAAASSMDRASILVRAARRACLPRTRVWITVAACVCSRSCA